MAAKKRATAKGAIDPDSIDLAGGAKEGKRLLAYAMQAGAAAEPLLAGAFDEGLQPMRLAACSAWALVDPASGVKHVHATLAELAAAKKPPRDELARLLACALALQSEAAYALAIDIVLAGARAARTDKMPDEAFATLCGVLAARFPRLPAADAHDVIEVLAVPARLRGLSDPAVDRAPLRALLTTLLDAPEAHPVHRFAAATTLAAWGDHESMRVLADRVASLPPEVAVDVHLAGDAAAAFEALAPQVQRGDHTRARIIRGLTPRADARWRSLAAELAARGVSVGADMLLRLGDVDAVMALARGTTLDRATETALVALGEAGHAEAAPLLWSWLERTSERDVVRRLLSALGSSGSLAHAQRLEQRLEVAATEHAGIMRLCASDIRRRLSTAGAGSRGAASDAPS